MLLDNGWDIRTPERHLAIDQQMHPFFLRASRRGLFETMLSPTSPLPFLSFIPTSLLVPTLWVFLKVLTSPILSHKIPPSESHETSRLSLAFFFFFKFFIKNSFQSSCRGLSAIISYHYLVWICNAWCASWKLKHVPAALSPVLFKGSLLVDHGHPHILDTGCHNAITQSCTTERNWASRWLRMLLLTLWGSATLFHLEPYGSGRGVVHSRKGAGVCVGGWGEGEGENSLSPPLLPHSDVGCAARIP